jgi:hypothetical protein
MVIDPNKFNLITNPEKNSDRVGRIKRLVNGEYTPKGRMDLYYGGNTYRISKDPFEEFFNKLIWGY